MFVFRSTTWRLFDSMISATDCASRNWRATECGRCLSICCVRRRLSCSAAISIKISCVAFTSLPRSLASTCPFIASCPTIDISRSLHRASTDMCRSTATATQQQVASRANQWISSNTTTASLCLESKTTSRSCILTRPTLKRSVFLARIM